MTVHYVPILKAKKGEFDALAKTRGDVSRQLLPLFEIGQVSEASVQNLKYLRESRTPLLTCLERVASRASDVWRGRSAMIDGFYLDPAASVETGEHIISFMAGRLSAAGVRMIPVIGYDRWESSPYRLSLSDVVSRMPGQCCLRLDAQAIEDSADPDFFLHNIDQITDDLTAFPSQCFALIDFGDISNKSIDQLIEYGIQIVRLLKDRQFRKFITCGCSIPNSIDLAVKLHDTVGTILRREVLVWKALREEFLDCEIHYGDYGVRGPTTNDGRPNPNINGKIRYTIPQQTLISRGHPISYDGSAKQMHALSERILRSPYYLGPEFSWGDGQIDACSSGIITGSSTDWIAIDTNHHLAFAVQEVAEFERRAVLAGRRRNS